MVLHFHWFNSDKSFLLILQNISLELRQIPFEIFPYFLLRKIFFIKFYMPPILSQRLCDKVFFYITILNNRNASPVETFQSNINLANIFHTQQHLVTQLLCQVFQLITNFYKILIILQSIENKICIVCLFVVYEICRKKKFSGKFIQNIYYRLKHNNTLCYGLITTENCAIGTASNLTDVILRNSLVLLLFFLLILENRAV